jgi:hypothetical protein
MESDPRGKFPGEQDRRDPSNLNTPCISLVADGHRRLVGAGGG